MKKGFQIFATAIFFMVISMHVKGQGCSDAGFCTIGNLGQQPTTAGSKQKISVFLPVGIGDNNVTVFTPAIQYDNRLNNKWAIQAKLSGNYASGELGSVAGAGDLFVSSTYIFGKKKKNWNFSGSLGAKLPLNNSNLKKGTRSLPMQYQSSLGTFDLIAGLSAGNKNWQFAAGWQQPLTGANENNFLPVFWTDKAAEKYAPSRKFNRKADLLLRGFYKHRFKNKLDLHGGLLAIYHVANDEYTDVLKNNMVISGSKGLTLNASISGWYPLSKKISLGLTVAAPLVVRDIRPDGLTRSFLVSPEINWNF